uniref:Protein kinase domain-containing protein n=1 Tax=Amphimedon queenslandica TaxID=400682 RepID=A0A1X7TMF2_AMPQE
MPAPAAAYALILQRVRVTRKELGRGSYGVVNELRVNGNQCAGKKLNDLLAMEDSLLSEFGNAIILHRQQHHPNIVKLLGVHYPSGSAPLPMLVMEYLPYSLLQLIEGRVAINKEAILLDVANGLDYLHLKRPPIIHRNIKASNILLTVGHNAKITDLSMSKFGDALKQHHYTTAPGNHFMMPPEALVHNPVYNKKLDVFSFGCLILHMFTGNIIVPTDQYEPKPHDPGSYVKISEWNRRAKYIKPVLDHRLIPVAMNCLQDDPFKRLNASDIIEIIIRLQLRPDRYAHLCGVHIVTILRTNFFCNISEDSFYETRIIELKDAITKLKGIPYEHIRLLYEGRQLADDMTFKDYKIEKFAKIYLSLRLIGS